MTLALRVTNRLVLAHLACIALRYDNCLALVPDLLTGAHFAPCGPVSGHDRLKHCSSLPDLIGRHLLIEYCGRDDLAHVPSLNPQHNNQGGASCTESDKA
ncbi:MAG: hypothetical protein JSR29_01465 [Nitrospira sp.]|nr:hypothetical protein [Nitrospira sp.]